MTKTLAERWNGRKWTIEPTPNPTGPTKIELDAVSCTAASACTAVGRSAGAPLVERWNGKRWKMQRTPPAGHPWRVSRACLRAPASPPGATETVPRHWPSAGTAGNGRSNQLPLRLPSGTATGTRRRRDLTPSPAARRTPAWLSAAMVPRPPTVNWLAERWNGRTWAPTPVPNGTSGDTLDGVSCASANACTAVGVSRSAERWNGSAWTTQPTQRHYGGRMQGVSCPSDSKCTSVGSRFRKWWSRLRRHSPSVGTANPHLERLALAWIETQR